MSRAGFRSGAPLVHAGGKPRTFLQNICPFRSRNAVLAVSREKGHAHSHPGGQQRVPRYAVRIAVQRAAQEPEGEPRDHRLVALTGST